MNDAERIAALLDGRLDSRQRAEVLARLGESEAAMDAFADAAAVLRETTDSTIAHRASRPHWRVAALALAACVVAAIVLVPVILSHSGQRSRDPGRFAAVLLADGISAAPGWNGTPWSTTRGDGSPLTAEARASRIGARLVDLDLATGDTSASHIANDIATLLDPLPASGPVVAIYRALAHPSGNVHQRDSLAALGRPAAAEIAGPSSVDLGAWTEAARLAAARHDAAFFRSAISRDMLPRAIERFRDHRADAQILSAVGTGTWDDVEDALTTLLQVLSS
jgi:hypothetical protein